MKTNENKMSIYVCQLLGIRRFGYLNVHFISNLQATKCCIFNRFKDDYRYKTMYILILEWDVNQRHHKYSVIHDGITKIKIVRFELILHSYIDTFQGCNALVSCSLSQKV